MNASLVFVLVLGGVASGCLDKRTGSGSGGPSTGNPTGPSSSPPPGGNGGLFNQTFRSIRWENCTGLVGLIPVSTSAAQQVLPDAFEPDGTIGGTTDALFKALQCGRVARANQVVEDAGFFMFVLRAHPRNESWGENDALPFYVLDLLVTDEGVSTELTTFGLPSKVAALTRNQQGPARIWRYEAQTLTVELEYAWTGEKATGPDVLRDNLWSSGEDGFRLVPGDERSDTDLAFLGTGALRMDGSSHAGPVLLNSCCAAYQGQSYSASEEVWWENVTIYR